MEKWINNLTKLESEIIYFDSVILPYHRLIVIFFSFFGLISSPFALFICYLKTPKNLKHFGYYGIYSRISLFIFSLIMFFWQPVCISPMLIIYSQGIIKNVDSRIGFILLWILISSGICSAHAIGSNILFLCKISLLPCNSWHGNPKKYKILIIFFGSLVSVTIALFWLTFPNSEKSLQDHYEIFPFLETFLSTKSISSNSSILAFNLINLTLTFKIFLIYLAILIPSYLLIFIYLFYDYHKTRRNQLKVLTRRARNVLVSLAISMKIRLIFIFSFLGFPFIFCCFCLAYGLPPMYFSLSLCMLSMFPFLDAFVEIFTIKFYRQKSLNILTCGFVPCN